MSARRAPPTAPGSAGSSDAVLAALAGAARREAHGEAPPEADARGRARVLAAFREPPRSRRPVAWLAVAATLVVVVGLALWLSPPAPLRFTVDGKVAAAGAYVHTPVLAAGVDPAALTPPASIVRFSDGSEIAFGAGAGGRVTEVGPRGARVLLETGTASFAIVHGPRARWSVEAGPFVIAVIGTAFDASWSAETQTFAVRLRAGEVSVVGPLAPAGVHVRAGQELIARVAEGELRLGEPTAASPPRPTATPPLDPPAADVAVAPPPSAAPAATIAIHHGGADLPGPPGSVGASASPVPPAQPGWPQRVASGDFRGVLAEADARGLDAVLPGVPLGDLAALADAARYAGRPDVARRALLAERARFAGSMEARGAAFLLGRLADDAGSGGAAVRWYDDYLTESPHGAFAAEALGRKLVALRRAADPAARATAVEYLHRYPEGPHAAAARELVSDP